MYFLMSKELISPPPDILFLYHIILHARQGGSVVMRLADEGKKG